MAKKINVKLIMELRDAGLSRNMIAATRHMSKNSVGDVIHIADRKGISFSDIRDLDEDAVYRMFYPDKFAVETLYAQPDYEYIHQELKRTGVTLKLLWQEYHFGSVSIKEQGYNPSLAVLRLSNKYSEARLEAACEYAIVNGIKRPRYHHLNSILASNQDEIYLEQKNAGRKNSVPMGYLRGSSYYGGGNDGQ